MGGWFGWISHFYTRGATMVPLGLSATRTDVCSIAAVEPNVPRSTQVLYNFLYNYESELTQ